MLISLIGFVGNDGKGGGERYVREGEGRGHK